MKRSILFSTVLMSGGFLAVSGCGSSAENASSDPDSPAAASTDTQSDAEHSRAEMDEARAELAKLDPADAASAESQRVCPVSGELLGSMGAPQKVDVNGRPVWICCEGCKDPLLADPQQYLAKLNSE